MHDLDKRKQKKNKKPAFIMQDAHKKARLKQRWRKPKGIQSKMRLHIKGYRRNVEVGWGSPAEWKGKDPKFGLTPVLVYRPSDVLGMDPAKHSAQIGGTVGEFKKLSIVKQLKEKGIKILNLKDADAFLKSAEDRFKERKEIKEKTQKEKQKRKEDLAKEAKKKEEKEAKESKKDASTSTADVSGAKEEQAQQAEKEQKEEKDKILTQKV